MTATLRIGSRREGAVQVNCFLKNRLAAARLPGIIQAPGAKDVPDAEVAYHPAERLGARRELVQPITALEPGLPLKAVPRHRPLDASRLRLALGMEPLPLWAAIDSVFP